jgi:FMN-dependent NADH-azoreductase
MEKILFINSCVRPRGVSRTLRLCEFFLDKFQQEHEDCEVNEISLPEEGLKSYGIEEIERRDKLIGEGRYDDEMFRYARSFAEADRLVIGAPLWDLSFPSILKVYVENICVEGLTFKYTETGSVGLAKFSKALYITTCGGYLQEREYGADYMKAVLGFLGNGEFKSFAAEGLDIFGNDIEAILSKAEDELAALAAEW